MAKYSKFNIVYLLQKWMDSVAGQTFMNYAYSWGAAVVILGTLFKLTHLPGANVMLFIGMGTEVFVFFISAFDRPFDKTTDGMELATDTQLAQELEKLTAMGGAAGSEGAVIGGGVVAGAPIVGGAPVTEGTPVVEGTPVTEGASGQIGGGAVIIGGGVIGGGIVGGGVAGNGVISGAVEGAEPAEGEAVSGGIVGGVVNGGVIGGAQVVTPAPAVSEETAEQMEEVTKTYIERLELLNETLLKVSALSEKLSIDSEEMENLNRTLTGIARVYEMQLKSASQQITTQDDINEQARIMAQKITELNSIYTRMIEAMTVNMPGGMRPNA